MKWSTPILLLLIMACHSKEPKRQDDSLYSRHLQRKVALTIIHNSLPDDKSAVHLLLLNDGQDIDQMRLVPILDSLSAADKIGPLVIVAIHAGDRMQEYGIADRPDFMKRGSKAKHYNDFVDNELLPFIKKRSGIRKFKSVAIAGWSLGGLSAFDIAWNNSDKIDMAGIFSGSFWWRDKDTNDSTYSDEKNRIILAKMKAARKKPPIRFWFMSGSLEETSDRDKDGIIDVQDDTEDLRLLLMERGLVSKENLPYVIDKLGKHDIPTWSRNLPDFLIWAFGK